jgi:hypothetical protein
MSGLVEDRLLREIEELKQILRDARYVLENPFSHRPPKRLVLEAIDKAL